MKLINNRCTIVLLFLLVSINPANAQFGIADLIVDCITNSIVASTRESSRGNASAEVDNKVINDAEAKARKNGVETAMRFKDGVNMNNVENVVRCVPNDMKRVLDAYTPSSLSLYKKWFSFGSLSDCGVRVSSEAYVNSRIASDVFDADSLPSKLTLEDKLVGMMGDSIAKVVKGMVPQERLGRLVQDLAESAKFRNAVRNYPKILDGYLQTFGTPLATDVVFLKYLDSDAMRYFNTNVMLTDKVKIIPVSQLSFACAKNVVYIKSNGANVASIMGNSITVENDLFMNYALLPNMKYSCGGMVCETDEIGRVVKVIAFCEKSDCRLDKDLARAFVNARRRFSGLNDLKVKPTCIIPVEYGGLCCGINVLPLDQEMVKNQKSFFKAARKTYKDRSFRVQVAITYMGASEVPKEIVYECD